MSDLPVINITPESRANAANIVKQYVDVLKGNPTVEQRATIAMCIRDALDKAGEEIALPLLRNLVGDAFLRRPSARYQVIAEPALRAVA